VGDACQQGDLILLASPAAVGTTTLDVEPLPCRLYVGDRVVIARGTVREEYADVVAFGSIIIASGVTFFHPTGTQVEFVPRLGDGFGPITIEDGGNLALVGDAASSGVCWESSIVALRVVCVVLAALIVVALLPICYLRYRAYAREKRSAGAPARTAPMTHREVAYTTEEYMEEEEEEEEVYEDSDGVVRAAPRYARSTQQQWSSTPTSAPRTMPRHLPSDLRWSQQSPPLRNGTTSAATTPGVRPGAARVPHHKRAVSHPATPAPTSPPPSPPHDGGPRRGAALDHMEGALGAISTPPGGAAPPTPTPEYEAAWREPPGGGRSGRRGRRIPPADATGPTSPVRTRDGATPPAAGPASPLASPGGGIAGPPGRALRPGEPGELVTAEEDLPAATEHIHGDEAKRHMDTALRDFGDLLDAGDWDGDGHGAVLVKEERWEEETAPPEPKPTPTPVRPPPLESLQRPEEEPAYEYEAPLPPLPTPPPRPLPTPPPRPRVETSEVRTTEVAQFRRSSTARRHGELSKTATTALFVLLLVVLLLFFVGFFLGACAATWTLFVLLCAVAILCVLLLWRLAGSPYFTCTMQVEIDREAFDAKERNPARVSTWQPAREVFRSDSGRLYL